MPITTKAVSSNPAHGDVYSIQHYVIKFISDFRQVGGFLQFISDFRQVGGFLQFIPVSSTNKTDGHLKARVDLEHFTPLPQLSLFGNGRGLLIIFDKAVVHVNKNM